MKVLIGILIALMFCVNVISIDYITKAGKEAHVGGATVKQHLSAFNSIAIAVMCVAYDVVCAYMLCLLIKLV